ncbi:MAG: YbaK/EbsC family protein [Gammaproteobacteria bacterium]
MIAAKVKHYLERYKISYQVFRHQRTKTLQEAAEALGICQTRFARAVVLGDKLGLLLVVLPLNGIINFEKLNQITGRNLRLLSGAEMDNIYMDCEPCSHVPLGEPYGLSMIIDKRLKQVPEIYFEAGCHNSLVRLSVDDFYFLTSTALWGDFADQMFEVQSSERLVREFVWDKLERFYVLPDCPLLSEASLDTLKSILNDSFMPEPDLIGPLARDAVWEHATLCAHLMRTLSEKSSASLRLQPELAYLAGWMHNVGFLVLGHFFKAEFRALNKLLQIYPKSPIQNLEQKLLGMGNAHHVIALGHTEMGAWLLRRWSMPAEVIAVASHHHESDFRGKDWPYVKLAYLVNQLLGLHGIGEGCGRPLIKSDFDALGLVEDEVMMALEDTIESGMACLDENVTLLWSR